MTNQDEPQKEPPKASNKKSSGKRKDSIWGLVGAVLIALTIRWAFFEAYVIPSGSMLPTLLINDHIFVNKLIYGIRWPFTDHWIVRFGTPTRGSVVVFRDPEKGKHGIMLIKRVIGVPGDKIYYHDDVLYINGKQIQDIPDPNHHWLDMIRNRDLENARAEHVELIEELGKTPHAILHRTDMYDRNFGPAIVPKGYLFMMGDHRDNSADSRYWGYAPIDNVIGRATFVWLSCGKTIPIIHMGCDPMSIRWSRFFHWIK